MMDTARTHLRKRRLPTRQGWFRHLTAGLTLGVLPLWVAFSGLMADAAFAFTPADPLEVVMINEVAWMGTVASTSDEWIELYNPGETTINLNGWVLRATDGAPSITLTGSIGPGAYYLLERTNDDTVAGIASDQIYGNDGTSFSLSNTGESLELVNLDSDVIDSANSDGGGWPAGSSTGPRCSMERIALTDTDVSWASSSGAIGQDANGNALCGTPKSANSTQLPTFTPAPTQTPSLTFTPSSTLENTFTPSPSASATLTPSPSNSVTPSITSTAWPARTVLINEVAWMGTLAESADEWIELHNPGTVDISLTGWQLRSADDGIIINLAGNIPAGGFYLLERTDNLVISDIFADQTYTGALADDDETLQLFAPDNSLVDTANADGGDWPAGLNTTSAKCSMERRGVLEDAPANWITNTGVVRNGLDVQGNPICGTPGQQNWAYTVTPTPTNAATPTRTRTPTRTPTRTRTPTAVPTAAVGSIVINEILPFPRSDWNGDGKVDYGDEFIEIINLSGRAVSLRNWKLDDQEGDSSPFTFGAVEIPAGERIVLFASETGLLLGNNQDTVRLYASNGRISDAYTYGIAQTPNQAWCRLPETVQQWSGRCSPTPGEENFLAPEVNLGASQSTFCLNPGLPAPVFGVECAPAGGDAWSRQRWPDLPLELPWREWAGQWILLE